MAGTAIFDLDRTITREPTWTRFLIFVNKRRPAFWLALPVLALHGLAHKLGLASRELVKGTRPAIAHLVEPRRPERGR